MAAPNRTEILRLIKQTCAAEADVYVCDETDSTNSLAKRLLSSGKQPPFLVTADTQTSGRGRLGRSFYSPSGSGMYLSVVYTPSGTGADAVRVTTLASVAVLRAVKRLMGKQLQIKWVNDLYDAGKKVCGILCEGVLDAADGQPRAVVVGVGVNMTNAAFPPELKDVAVSLNAPDVSRERMIAAVTEELWALLSGDDPDYMEEYRQHSMVLGRTVSYIKEGVSHTGTAVRVGDNGTLYVRRDDGAQDALSTGEITLRVR